jgi:hypothetical protein
MDLQVKNRLEFESSSRVSAVLLGACMLLGARNTNLFMLEEDGGSDELGCCLH